MTRVGGRTILSGSNQSSTQTIPLRPPAKVQQSRRKPTHSSLQLAHRHNSRYPFFLLCFVGFQPVSVVENMLTILPGLPPPDLPQLFLPYLLHQPVCFALRLATTQAPVTWVIPPTSQPMYFVRRLATTQAPVTWVIPPTSQPMYFVRRLAIPSRQPTMEKGRPSRIQSK